LVDPTRFDQKSDCNLLIIFLKLKWYRFDLLKELKWPANSIKTYGLDRAKPDLKILTCICRVKLREEEDNFSYEGEYDLP
jgi:hypothetical protein